MRRQSMALQVLVALARCEDWHFLEIELAHIQN